MPATTRSEIRGLNASFLIVDDALNATVRPLTYEDFNLVRFDRRDYGFVLGGKTEKRYQNTSKHAAKRRFEKWLALENVTRRLTS